MRFVRCLLTSEQELRVGHSVTPDQCNLNASAVSQNIGDRCHARLGEAHKGDRLVLRDDDVSLGQRYPFQVWPDAGQMIVAKSTQRQVAARVEGARR